MLSGWTVKLGWLAQVDLRHAPWDDERELGGVLMGQLDRQRKRLLVERALPNPSGPHEPRSTTFDIDVFSRLEFFNRNLKYPLPTPKDGPHREYRILGNFHSHPSGNTRASEPDFESWRLGATGVGHPFLGAIATAGSERWWQGEPDGLDWRDDLNLGWWLTTPDGDCEAAPVILEERWLWALEDRLGLHDEVRVLLRKRKPPEPEPVADADDGEWERYRRDLDTWEIFTRSGAIRPEVPPPMPPGEWLVAKRSFSGFAVHSGQPILRLVAAGQRLRSTDPIVTANPRAFKRSP